MNSLTRAESALREFALSYPDAIEDFPWGHVAVKVKGKAFLFMSNGKAKPGEELNLSVKLPLSGKFALIQPFASPTEYGLGKSGWVTARFKAGDEVPVDRLMEWIDESFRAIAPKKAVQKLDNAEADGEQEPRTAPQRKRTKRRAAK